MISGYHRVTWRHDKGNGESWDITTDLCPGHEARVAGRRLILATEPAPMMKNAGRQVCTFCAGLPYVKTKQLYP